jgi:hypothetical protein
MKSEEKVQQPRTKELIYLMISLVIMGIIATGIFLREYYTDHYINITVAEDEYELKIIAEFPEEKSKALHDYLRTQINLSDLPDLDNVVIKKYHTPDDKMIVYLKSTPGYLKIILVKQRNSKEAYLKLKNASEGIKHVFTRTEPRSITAEPVFHGWLFILSFI